MMKMIRKIAVIALSLIFTFVCVMSLAGACFAGNAYADDEEYTYTVKVYSGKEGSFGDDAKHTWTKSGLSYGDTVTLSISDMDLRLEDPDKYYVRGIKIAGHDNDEISRRNYMSYTFEVKGDESFSVVYGIKGGMVKYTVQYVDADDASVTISEPDEYYGMVGDKPVVSYKYIDGYLPEAYNLTKTITENESENVFTFEYTSTGGAAEDEDADADDDADGGGGAAAGAGGAGGAAAGTGDGAAAGDGTTINDDATPQAGPSDVVDLDDNDTPMSKSAEDEKSGISPIAVAGIALGAAAIAAAVILFIRRRNAYEYDDDDEEE